MRDLFRRLLDHDIDRREFLSTLLAVGFSTAAAESVLASALAPDMAASPRELVGTGGEVLAETLRAAGVEYIFDCNSTGQNPLYDALSTRPDLNLIIALQEGQAASMAHGYELASGRTAALVVPSIGTPNALSNLYNAWKDRSSLAVFSDGRDNRFDGRDGFQQLDDWLQPTEQFTKWRWEVIRPDRIAEIARRAIKLASTPPGGPVYVRIPTNVLGTGDLEQTIYDQQSFDVAVTMPPRDDDIERAAQALIEAERPFINAGAEVTRAGANAELIELAELLGAPVSQALSVFGDFPYRHPLAAGFFSMGFPTGLGGADLLLNVGGRVPDSTVISGLPKAMRVIDTRVEYDKIANIHPTDIAIAAGTRETLRALIDAVKSAAPSGRLRDLSETRLAAARERRVQTDERRTRRAAKAWDASPVSDARLCFELDRALDDDAIVVVETGDRTPQDWMDLGPGRKRLIGPTTGFALGWGVGAALGAKIARPNQQVVSLVGDGAFLFGQIESLWTASRYDIPVIVVVFNNRSYDAERGRMFSFSRMPDKQNWKDMACYLGNPDIDYLKIAQGFDIDGTVVARPADVAPAIKKAVRATREGRPYLIDALVARKGPAAESTWHPDISIAARRDRAV